MSKENLTRYLTSTNLVSITVAMNITGQFKEKVIAKNQYLLTAGKVADDYLFLNKGYMRAFAFQPDGDQVTTNFYSPGEVVFEVSSFFTRTRAKENIQALTDCNGWAISYQQLNNLFHQLPEFREFGRSVIVKGFADLKTRTLSMITETAEQRYNQLLAVNPEIFQHTPLKTIASYLGITDTSLSRIRKDLSKK